MIIAVFVLVVFLVGSLLEIAVDGLIAIVISLGTASFANWLLDQFRGRS